MSESVAAQPSLPETSAPTAPAAWPRTGALALIIGLLVLAALISWIAFTVRVGSPAFNGGEYSPPQAAPALDLTDQNGNPFSLAAQAGKVTLIYFGYTTCPDLCPTTLSDFQVVKDELGPQADRVNFVLTTLDPERDTQARLKEYLAFFDDDFVGLRGDTAQTEAFLRDYGITVQRVDYPDSATGYLLDHTALVYLIDPEGRLRLSYPYGTDPLLIAEDVRNLLAG